MITQDSWQLIQFSGDKLLCIGYNETGAALRKLFGNGDYVER